MLWPDTAYLLDGPSHQQTIQLLDEFLASASDKLITDALMRALFQRQMWAVYDWLAFQPDPYPAGRRVLQQRLAAIIRRLALTSDEILSLPDNYAAAVASKTFATEYQVEQRDTAFLPPDLFRADSAWVPLGRAGGPVAMSHTEEFPFFGRSVFLVFIRMPGGRDETLNFIDVLNTEQFFQFPIGLDVALVRRALVINTQGNLQLSPLVEIVQLRHFSPEQSFHAFSLSRADLLGSIAGGLHPVSGEFILFRSHGDVFESPHHRPSLKGVLPDLCKGCHFNDGSGLQRSLVSYSRMNFPLPNQERPILSETDWIHETQIVTRWKLTHPTWQSLLNFWNQEMP